MAIAATATAAARFFRRALTTSGMVMAAAMTTTPTTTRPTIKPTLSVLVDVAADDMSRYSLLEIWVRRGPTTARSDVSMSASTFSLAQTTQTGVTPCTDWHTITSEFGIDDRGVSDLGPLAVAPSQNDCPAAFAPS